MSREILSSSVLLSCSLFDVTRTLIQENGIIYDRELVVHPGSAVVVPFFEDGSVALVRQYRHAAAEEMLELPAGSIEDGETALECAAREIREETGYEAADLSLLTEFYVSPGFLTERMTVFLATGLSENPSSPDEDEFLQVVKMPLAAAAEMAFSGGFRDAKTMLGLMAAERAVRLSL